jgi:hypothetical protein
MSETPTSESAAARLAEVVREDANVGNNVHNVVWGGTRSRSARGEEMPVDVVCDLRLAVWKISRG